MSGFYDIFDWLGGYPYEFAKPEEIFDFYRKRGFVLERLITCGGKMGCNEFMFRRDNESARFTEQSGTSAVSVL